MSEYKGKPVVVPLAAEVLAEKFADLSVMQTGIDQLPEEQRAKLGDTRFEKDAIVIKNPQVGEMRFAVVERTPSQIRMASDGVVAMEMKVKMTPQGESATELVTSIDVDLPFFIRPMVGPYLQQAADKMSEMIGKTAAGDGL